MSGPCYKPHVAPSTESACWGCEVDRLKAERDVLRARCETMRSNGYTLEARILELRAALELLVGWADSVHRRVGVRMGDANTGAIEIAKQALGLAP